MVGLMAKEGESWRGTPKKLVRLADAAHSGSGGVWRSDAASPDRGATLVAWP
jgi:hypothetical protein